MNIKNITEDISGPIQDVISKLTLLARQYPGSFIELNAEDVGYYESFHIPKAKLIIPAILTQDEETKEVISIERFIDPYDLSDPYNWTIHITGRSI